MSVGDCFAIIPIAGLRSLRLSDVVSGSKCLLPSQKHRLRPK